MSISIINKSYFHVIDIR